MTATAEMLLCGDCHHPYRRPSNLGRVPTRCPDCHKTAKALRQRERAAACAQAAADDVVPPRLAANIVRYRLGIELARTGLRCGRQQEVVQILDAIIDGTADEPMLTEQISRAAQRATLTRLKAAGVDLTPAAAYLQEVSA